MIMMIIILKRRRTDSYSRKKGGLGSTKKELFGHEILVERNFKNLCKNISALLPPTFAPQGFGEKWDFGMKNLETDVLWTFLIQNWLLEKPISFRKDYKGEVLTPLITISLPQRLRWGWSSPGQQCQRWQCWSADSSTDVVEFFRGLFWKKIPIHDFLIFLTGNKNEAETHLWVKMPLMPFSRKYDSNLKDSRCFAFLLFSFSQFALGQFLE